MITAKLIRRTKGGGLQGLSNRLPQAAEKGILAALDYTHGLAVKFSRGRVADSIQMELLDTANWKVLGRVYTISPFSAFLEYGTGIYMEPNPLGHIPGSAGDRGEAWFVHEDMADLSRYHFPVLETKMGRFYIIKGTRAHPYMKPAAFQSRDKNARLVAETLQSLFREVGQSNI